MAVFILRRNRNIFVRARKNFSRCFEIPARCEQMFEFSMSRIENKMELLSQSSDRNSISDLNVANALARNVFLRCVGVLIQYTKTILALDDCSAVARSLNKFQI